MTFSGQTRIKSMGAKGAAMAFTWPKHSLLLAGRQVNGNGVSARRGNLSDLSKSIPVGKVARTVVIPSDMTKQVADTLPEAAWAFRIRGREEER